MIIWNLSETPSRKNSSVLSKEEIRTKTDKKLIKLEIIKNQIIESKKEKSRKVIYYGCRYSWSGTRIWIELKIGINIEEQAYEREKL